MKHLPAKLVRKSAEKLAFMLCPHRHRSLVRLMHNAFTAFRYRFENVDFNFETNGEKRVLQRLALARPETVFDVGANTGDYAVLASQLCQGATIHSFEPLPATYELLKNRVTGLPDVRLNNFGLGERDQWIDLHTTGAGDVTASAFKMELTFGEPTPRQCHSVQIKRGEEYLQSAGVPKVDFLKIDVEGMEYEVLRGFGGALASRVDCIQFEYGVYNISSHYLLRDLCRLLVDQGFVIGKIFPSFVEFFEYHFTREDFLGNNYIAVRRDRTDLLRLLA